MRRGFTIHHNGPPANCIGKPHSRCVAFWAAVKAFHTNPEPVGKGWSDIAYSFGVCLSLDNTEVLSRRGWLPLGAVGPDDEVASWAADSGVITFDRPLGFTPAHEAEVIKVHHWEMTPDHRMFVRDYRYSQPWKERPASEVRTGHLIPAQGSYGSGGLPISDDLLRFLVWVQADGSYIATRNGLVTVRFHFAKERKVERLLGLVERLGLNHTARPCHGGQHTRINIYAADWLRENVARWMPAKQFTWEFLELSQHQADVMLDEIPHADGDTRGRYYTAVRQNADVVAAICVLNGRKAAVVERHDRHLFEVQVSHRTEQPDWVWSPSAKVDDTRRTTLVGCIETVNGTIVIRQNGRVVIVGNCPHGERLVGRGWDRRQWANGTDMVGADDGDDSDWYSVLVFVGGDDSTNDTEPPTAEMVQATAALIGEGRGSGRCGARVLPHNAFKRKPCPGPEFSDLAVLWDDATLIIPPPYSTLEEDMPLDNNDRAWLAEQLGKTAAVIVTGKGNALANAAQPGWGWLADRPASIAGVAAALASIDIEVTVDPEDIQALADAIPGDIAGQVADLLHARLAG